MSRTSLTILTLAVASEQPDLLIEKLSDRDAVNVADDRDVMGLVRGIQTGIGLESGIADVAIQVFQHRRAPALRGRLLMSLEQFRSMQHAENVGNVGPGTGHRRILAHEGA